MSVEDFRHTPDRPVGSVLSLYPEGGKWLDATPDGIEVGAVRLRGWDLRPVRPVPPGYEEQDVYLVKLVHELDLEPGIPRPAWMEIGYRFLPASSPAPDAGGPLDDEVDDRAQEAVQPDEAKGSAFVVDALPRTVLDPEPAADFALNRSLMLVQSPDTENLPVRLDAQEPDIDVFGIGGPEIRWRYAAARRKLRLGTHVAWIVLAVPAGTDQILVRVAARFAVEASENRPASGSEPEYFTLPLTTAAPSGPVLPPTPSLPRTRLSGQGPSLFICYTHKPPRHRDQVLRFAEFLRAQGCDPRIDSDFGRRRRNWNNWSTREILASRYSLVIASPWMLAVGNGEVGPNQSRGLRSELDKLGELLQADAETWLPRVLPVVLPGNSVEHIPLMFKGRTEDHYVVRDLTPEGARSLLETIFHEFHGERPRTAPTPIDNADLDDEADEAGHDGEIDTGY
jgi:hypothetical protein